MLEKDKLRKADIFSGGAIFFFGLWVISQALKMPMKDSWGGVQNVWFVSPALFPLFVGAMIALLGLLLVRTAFKAVGLSELKRVLAWLGGRSLLQYLQTAPPLRFFAMALLFFSFVFLNLPRVDFFLCSILFLAVFITMFYFDDDGLLQKLFFFYLAGTIACIFLFSLGVSEKLASILPYPDDWVIIVFVFSHLIFVWRLVRRDPVWRRKYRVALILAVVPPFMICPIFKYFLLVPMPTEGLISAALDAVWYWIF